MATTTATETKTLVNYRVEDGIAVIELNDPPANTYTYEMNRQLDECILTARMDNDVYVLVLTGSGDRAFVPLPPEPLVVVKDPKYPSSGSPKEFWPFNVQ